MRLTFDPFEDHSPLVIDVTWLWEELGVAGLRP